MPMTDKKIVFHQNMAKVPNIYYILLHTFCTVCLKKTSPTFLAVTRESIVGFS